MMSSTLIDLLTYISNWVITIVIVNNYCHKEKTALSISTIKNTVEILLNVKHTDHLCILLVLCNYDRRNFNKVKLICQYYK